MGPKPKPVAERFWPKVQKTETCWLWTASLVHGYGQMGVPGSRLPEKAHRISWVLANGPIPDGLHVLHKCDVRACVRPDHLYLGTNLDNIRDRQARTRHHSAVLSEADVAEIRRAYAEGGVLQRELAERYGVTQTRISKILRTPDWRGLPMHLAG